jgi:hypothetical protein
MSAQTECPVIFTVSGGIYGVGRLATRLNALVANHQISEWHAGHWVDWRHAAIRINFATAAEAALAKSTCNETPTA